MISIINRKAVLSTTDGETNIAHLRLKRRGPPVVAIFTTLEDKLQLQQWGRVHKTDLGFSLGSIDEKTADPLVLRNYPSAK